MTTPPREFPGWPPEEREAYLATFGARKNEMSPEKRRVADLNNMFTWLRPGLGMSPTPVSGAPASTPKRKRSPAEHSVAPATLAMASALGAYCAIDPPATNISASKLARLAADYASERGFVNSDLIDATSHTMRDMARDILTNMRQAGQTKTRARKP
jgi:hypothetical protein